MIKLKKSLLFPIIFCIPAINYYIAQMFYAFESDNSLANVLYALIYISGILVYFQRRNKTRETLIVVVTTFMLLYSVLVTSGVWTAITTPVFLQSLLMKLICIYLPIVILVSTNKEGVGTMMLSLLPIIMVINILCVLAFVFQILNMGILQEYMTFAYTALPSILMGTYYGFTLKKRILLIVSSAAALTIVFGGCRGALLSMLMFYAIFLLFGIKNIGTRFIVTILIAYLFLNLSSFLDSGNSILRSYGYESRILSFVENENLAESESRYEVYKKAVSIIDYYGHGIFSDRVLLQHVREATHCHNWVLELLVDFGWILGPIIIFFIITYLYGLVKHRPSGDIHYNFMLFFSLTMLLTKYMLSSSYLDSSECALIAGWFIYCYRSKKHRYATA